MDWLSDWPLALPWAPFTAPRSDTDVSAGPGPASDGPGAGPSLISPACQDAKLEDLEGLPEGRLGTAHHLRRYPGAALGRKYRNSLFTHQTAVPGQRVWLAVNDAPRRPRRGVRAPVLQAPKRRFRAA